VGKTIKINSEVSDELFAKLREHFDESQMVELTSAIAWENYRARFIQAFDIEAQGFAKGAYCLPPERPVKQDQF
jgi:alkylhydroperoxidase family enzyme